MSIWHKLNVRPPNKYELLNPIDALCYVKQVLDNNRCTELEPIIATGAPQAYAYARDVLKHRFIEAEEVIAQDLPTACCYALNVINGRFIEAEPNVTNLKYYRMAFDTR